MSSLSFVDRDPRASVRVIALAAAVAVNAAALISLTLPSPPSALLLPALLTQVTAVLIEPPVMVPPPPLPEPPPLPMRPKVEKARAALPPPTPTAPPIPTVDPSPVLPLADTKPSMPVTSSAVDTNIGSAAGSGNGAMQTLDYMTRKPLAYPIASVRNREQGEVVLRVLVNGSGQPERIEIERSSGYAKLDRAAREAVQQWTFRPVLRNGVPTAAWGVVPVSFRLDQG